MQPPRLHLQPGLTTLDMEPCGPASETFEVEQCHGNGGCQAVGFAPHMSRTWKNGWLFESFVGMATRHLHSSKSLGQVCVKQVLSRCLFHQTLTGIW